MPIHQKPFGEGHKRRFRIQIVLATSLLLVLVVASGLIAEHLLAEYWETALPSAQIEHPGPFIRPLLSWRQVDALRHSAQRMGYKQLARLYVSRMTLDEELGQLIMVEYDDTTYSPDLDTMISKLHAGGVIMYEFQMLSVEQTRHDIDQMQQHALLPLLISADEEGGYVHRLLNIYPPRPSAEQIFETGNPSVAAQQGHLVAHDMRTLGINVNLAPDVDVALVQGPDQVTRTFGSTVDSVVTFAGAYMKAMQQDGVAACIKHYPGLGSADIDAHFGLPVVNRSKEDIYATDLAPFKTFIQTKNGLENPALIMPTDVLMPAIDAQMPAELSHIFMTDILRKQFGYDGVVLTDALYMKGISETWSMPQAAVLALNAGNDMLLGPTGTEQMQEMLTGLKNAVKDGSLSKARIDEAATRIVALKMAQHLLPAQPPV